jgi:alginate O-acetyltransferase complex protein AlgI
MLFNSFQFISIVLITFLLYYLPLLRKVQVHLLIGISLFVYAYNQPYLLALLIVSILINGVLSFIIINTLNVKFRKVVALAGIIANLSILIFFKYNFLLATLFSIETYSSLGFLITLPLPIGISFYTFHGISFLIDTYKSKNNFSNEVPFNLKNHLLSSSLYMAFFPQLVAGPIVKSKHFMPQIKHKEFKNIEWENTFKALVTGYFLKLVIADNLKDQTYWINFPYFLNKSTLHLGALVYGFSIQIFADFAGYSLIAIGLAKLFGYNLIENFNFPYISRSFSEFWQRWHISLSSWLREYLYFPLGGNKKGKFRTYLNLMIVMFLGGLWHGAAWSYAIWGLFHGTLLVLERIFEKTIQIPQIKIFKFLRVIVVFSFVTWGWLLFKLTNFNHVIEYMKAFSHNRYWELNSNMIYIFLFSIPVVVYHLLYLYQDNNLKHINYIKPFVYGTMLFLIVTNHGSASEFIYFQF